MRAISTFLSVVTPFCLAALPSNLAAQGSIVIPPGAATADGNSADAEPLAYDQVRHIQYIGPNLLTGLAPNTLIKEIDYRRDGNIATPATMVRYRGTKVKPVWQVRLGNVAFAGAFSIMNPPSDYPTATTVGWATVIPGMLFDFPDLPLTNGAGNPQNFDLKFLLPTPTFFYTGPNLGIDHYAYETSFAQYSGTYVMDAANGGAAGGSCDLITPGSVGCPANQNRAYGSSANPGAGDLVMNLYGAEPNKNALACLGTSATLWGAIPLPLDLSSVLQLPGCKVYTDLSVTVARGTGAAGIAEFRTPIPANAAFAGANFYGQWVAQDSRVNPLVGLATSDGLKYVIGPNVQPQMSVVSGINFLAQGRSGLVQPGRGLVVRIGW